MLEGRSRTMGPPTRKGSLVRLGAADRGADSARGAVRISDRGAVWRSPSGDSTRGAANGLSRKRCGALASPFRPLPRWLPSKWRQPLPASLRPGAWSAPGVGDAGRTLSVRGRSAAFRGLPGSPNRLQPRGSSPLRAPDSTLPRAVPPLRTTVASVLVAGVVGASPKRLHPVALPALAGPAAASEVRAASSTRLQPRASLGRASLGEEAAILGRSAVAAPVAACVADSMRVGPAGAFSPLRTYSSIPRLCCSNDALSICGTGRRPKNCVESPVRGSAEARTSRSLNRRLSRTGATGAIPFTRLTPRISLSDTRAYLDPFPCRKSSEGAPVTPFTTRAFRYTLVIFTLLITCTLLFTYTRLPPG